MSKGSYKKLKLSYQIVSSYYKKKITPEITAWQLKIA